MMIYRLGIRRFRGIRELDWTVNSNFVCLIGPGDSTKSTILDAIELVLSPRWNVPFNDTDFHNADVSEPINITITVGQIPEKLLQDEKFGLFTRGWSKKEGLHDEPEEGDELVLSIQLQVDSSLEPFWRVINDRVPEGVPISFKDRELIGVARLGAFIDHHLSWRRGSILSRLTGKVDELPRILAEASRFSRKSLDPKDLQSLHSVVSQIHELGKRVGVAPIKEYCPALDVQALSVGEGGISLHDGDVPVRRAGLGSRRLISLAMQHEISKEGGVTLVDEVEHALEPHRICCLLYFLRQSTGQENQEGGEIALPSGQVIMTTHSPVVLLELNASELCIVRAREGAIKVQAVPSDLQGVIRKAPYALLGRKVIVCEGKTELGICRFLDKWWYGKQKEAFAYLGVVPIDGRGSDAPKSAVDLANLGYPVAFLGDSDQPINPDPKAMMSHGICVLLWEENLATEQRVIRDLPWQGVIDLVRLAMDEWTEESVLTHLKEKIPGLSNDLANWNDSPSLRGAIGLAAKEYNKKKGWFKRIDLGEKLGEIITKYLEKIPETDLAKKLFSLREWIDGD